MTSTKELRESLGLSQNQFAKITGIPQGTISAIESGRRSLSHKTIEKICSTCGVSCERFLKDPPVSKSPRLFIKVGEQHGSIFVDKEYQKGENGKKYKHYDCHCVNCGKNFCMSGGSIMQMAKIGCSNCNKNNTRASLRAKYVGQKFGSIEVTDVMEPKKIHGRYQLLVEGKCLLCGEKVEYPLNRLKQQPPFSCDKCAKSNWLSKGAEANKKLHVNGTNLAAIASRKNGSVNKNNSSGVNGVCRGKSGKWRAYIVLRGRQYYLGNFSELDDAIAARKNAEKKFFDPEIIKFVDQNPKTWKKLLKADQQPDNSNDKSNAKI